MTLRCGSVELDASLPAALRDALCGAGHAPASVAGCAKRGAAQFQLRQTRDGLELMALMEPALGVLRIDLLHGSAGWRSGVRARSERLVRACGVLRGETAPMIIDGTGGLGTDSWLLASAGATVITCERHPVLAALLRDGVQRAAVDAPDVAARIRILEGDVRGHLDGLEADVLYLDPMYPQRRKAALGDRRLRFLAALLAARESSSSAAAGVVAAGVAAADVAAARGGGAATDAAGSRGAEGDEAGDDAAPLVQAGLARGMRRVVLKRPRHAAVDVVRPPSHSLEGRSTRFDVWVSAPASRR